MAKQIAPQLGMVLREVSLMSWLVQLDSGEEVTAVHCAGDWNLNSPVRVGSQVNVELRAGRPAGLVIRLVR